MPSPEAQVKNYECLLKAMRNHDRILEQKSGISLCTCNSCPAENINFAACASKMAFVFFHHCDLQKHLCEAPRTADTLQLPPPIVNPPRTPHPRPPWLEAFHHLAQTLGAGLMETSAKRFVPCNQDACLENPGCKHFSPPGSYTQLFLLQDSASQKGYPS